MAVAKKPKTANVVTVGCKIPNGLVLRVNDVEVTIAGSNSSKVIGGYGLTQVDADFWSAWLERNSGLSFVRNDFVFAHEKAASTKAQANEMADEKTGLEQLDPNAKPAGITDLDK